MILSSFSAYLALHSILETLASLGETEPVRALAAAFHPALPQLFQFVFCRPFDFHPAPLQQLGPLLVVQSHNRSSGVVSQILKFRNSRVLYSLQELFLRKFVHFSPKFKTHFDKDLF